jgi:hypothetical protein
MSRKSFRPQLEALEARLALSTATPPAITSQPLPPSGAIFEVKDYSFDIEQVLNVGAQASGAGAGKVTFNPFSITRKIDIDKASPVFFKPSVAAAPTS